MKKAILFTLPLAMLVAACGGGNQGINKGNIFTAEFMEANKTVMLSENPYVANYEIGVDEKVSLGSNVTVTNDGSNPGLVEITNSDSKTAKFSLVAGKIIAPFGFGDFSSVPYSVAGHNFKVYKFTTTSGTTTTYYMIDEYGNELYRGDKAAPAPILRTLNKEERKSSQEYVSVIIASDAGTNEFIYNVDGSLSRSGAFAPAHAAGETLGYLVQNSMKDYGHEDVVYTHAQHNNADRYYFRDIKANKSITSIEVPNGATRFFVGDYLIYQYTVELEERATSYSFFYVGGGNVQHKCNLETYRVNYMTGAKERLERNFLFGNQKGYFSSDKVKRFELVDAQLIREDRSLEPDNKEYFVNDNCEMIADVSGVNFRSLIVSNGKYISKTGVVYNEKLEEVNYIQGLDTVTDPDCHVFIENGFRGICDYDAKVLEAAKNTAATRLLKGVYTLKDPVSYRTVKLEGNSVLSEVGSFKYETYSESGIVPGTNHVKALSDGTVSYSYNELSGVVTPRVVSTDTEDFAVNATFFGETGKLNARVYYTSTNDWYALRSSERAVYAIPEI